MDPATTAAKSLQAKDHPRISVVSGSGVEVLTSKPPATPGRHKAVELSAFFERLRLVLEDRQMTQADLARELGVGTATVSEWFTRGRVPSGDVMLRLPHALDVSGHWLLTGEGAKELGWDGNQDPYLRGVRDTLARLDLCLTDVGRQLGLPDLPRNTRP
jgi:transcriptional regulator with XRE-family HTH domain